MTTKLPTAWHRVGILSILTVLLSICYSPLSAQTLPYFHGFEDPVENANWYFHAGSAFSNLWTIGTAEYRMGTHGLYISHNNGANAAYVNTKGSAVVYREFTLPAGSIYEVDFDWKCLGNGTDELYVCWVTNPTENVIAWANNNNAVPTGVRLYGKTWTGRASTVANPYTKADSVMTSFTSWQHGRFTVGSSGTPAKLVFFWTNSQTGVNNPGGCIDNVQINRRQGCPQPTNITFTYSSTSQTEGYLTWNGNASSWDVMYKNDFDTLWTTHTGLTSRTDTITNLTKGIYTFYVRANCVDDTSSWAVLGNVLIYTSLSTCINYADLNNPNTTCTYGTTLAPYQNTGVIDFGSGAMKSRHTVHYGIGEYDRQTGNQLTTVPPGEVASVRLGNWDTHGEGESITYTFVVDSASPLILLQYAVVLQNPSNSHTSQQMPNFRLEILDMSDQLVDPACGTANFVVGDNTQD